MLGASYDNNHVFFRVWAPDAKTMSVVINTNPGRVVMTKSPDGYFTATAAGLRPGASYSYYIDDRGPFPDPASRYQPEGVHGPSIVVDPASYKWHDLDWKGVAFEDLVFYELHIGAFTPEGTYRSAAAKLPYLKDLGITAVELMPLSDFAGDRNWGYDGVAPFAPAHVYGSPDDLRFFVDQAHQLGLAVFLDVVYNHFGPDGAYQGTFTSHYFTKRHHTPWGDAINFECNPVREYVIESAQSWVKEFHFDGLRLDATHAIVDDSPQHILAAIRSAVAPAYVIAEDCRNLPELITSYGLSAIWADDFHHQLRRMLAGDRQGYFAEFDGTLPSLVKLIQRRWWRGKRDTTGIPDSKFVYCIQNHDQIGNRALGDRLNHNIDAASYRAASALLLLLPQTPLLFMGQEWSAGTPFLYFTDHHDELGRAVTEGRGREFPGHEFADPQLPETFHKSKLKWDEVSTEPHASTLRLYKSLLRLRPPSSTVNIRALDAGTLHLERPEFTAVIRLLGNGEVCLPTVPGRMLWNSEDPAFAPDPQPITLHNSQIGFACPGAIVFAEKQ